MARNQRLRAMSDDEFRDHLGAAFAALMTSTEDRDQPTLYLAYCRAMLEAHRRGWTNRPEGWQ